MEVTKKDRLLSLLLAFFELPSGTPPEEIAQAKIEAWDSLAMVQLLAELQQVFGIDFELSEIEALRSYDEIRVALRRKGIELREVVK